MKRIKPIVRFALFNLLVALSCKPAAAYIQKGSFTLMLGGPFKTMKTDIKSDLPMLTFLGEKKISHVGIGFFLSVGEFDGYHEEHTVNVYKVTPQTGDLIMPGIRLNFYPIQQDRFDVYGGLMLSYLFCSNGVYPDGGGSGGKLASDYMGPKVGFQIGAHYWFSQHFGVVAEVGYGVATYNFGLVLGK